MKLYAIGSIGNDFYIVKLANKMFHPFLFPFKLSLRLFLLPHGILSFQNGFNGFSLSLSLSLSFRIFHFIRLPALSKFATRNWGSFFFTYERNIYRQFFSIR